MALGLDRSVSKRNLHGEAAKAALPLAFVGTYPPRRCGIAGA